MALLLMLWKRYVAGLDMFSNAVCERCLELLLQHANVCFTVGYVLQEIVRIDGFVLGLQSQLEEERRKVEGGWTKSIRKVDCGQLRLLCHTSCMALSVSINLHRIRCSPDTAAARSEAVSDSDRAQEVVQAEKEASNSSSLEFICAVVVPHAM